MTQCREGTLHTPTCARLGQMSALRLENEALKEQLTGPKAVQGAP
jgi:hypothetical protein